jgi:hypothetical protein
VNFFGQAQERCVKLYGAGIFVSRLRRLEDSSKKLTLSSERRDEFRPVSILNMVRTRAAWLTAEGGRDRH